MGKIKRYLEECLEAIQTAETILARDVRHMSAAEIEDVILKKEYFENEIRTLMGLRKNTPIKTIFTFKG